MGNDTTSKPESHAGIKKVKKGIARKTNYKERKSRSRAAPKNDGYFLNGDLPNIVGKKNTPKPTELPKAMKTAEALDTTPSTEAFKHWLKICEKPTERAAKLIEDLKLTTDCFDRGLQYPLRRMIIAGRAKPQNLRDLFGRDWDNYKYGINKYLKDEKTSFALELGKEKREPQSKGKPPYESTSSAAKWDFEYSGAKETKTTEQEEGTLR